MFQLHLGNRLFELFVSIEILTHLVYPLVCINTRIYDGFLTYRKPDKF